MDNEFVKKTEEEVTQENGTKLFGNKAANKAIMIAFGIVIVVIIGLAIFANM